MDVAGQPVEVVAYIIERLPHEPQLALLLAHDRSNLFSRTMLGRRRATPPRAPAEIARCRTLLQHTHIDWTALGYDDKAIDELVEFLLRIIQSMVIAPPEPPRSSTELRAYVRRWVGPAVNPSFTTLDESVALWEWTMPPLYWRSKRSSG